MSFTAEVKDELSRVEGICPSCEYAELSALVHVCGTLSFHGSGSYSVRITTETGAVARTLIRLIHKLFDLETALTVRRSLLHKSRNYLIELAEQDGLEDALVRLGILVPGRGLAPGVSPELVSRDCCLASYLRGVFMAGGFIADPRGDFHLEMAVTGDGYAHDLVDLCSRVGVSARLNHRRGSWAVYLKSYDDIERMLFALGATRSAKAVENVRRMKTVKSDVNRRVNAEIANQARAGGAAADQLALIAAVEREVGLSELSPALREFCQMRRDNPDLSLAELGQAHEPPLSKSALYHRVLRLQATLDEARSTADRDQLS
jgi:DNA-binding protein WhiA